MKRLLMALVRGWQLTFGAWLGPTCRFTPSCSVYSMQALQRHGAVAGTWLTVHRIARCGPWCQGGDDPVPLEKPRLFTHLTSTPNKNNS
ncbi:membrane protein insertion efficiency factor YidD [Ramlibacter sp. PS4R-6]|uniref:membrane protein insertion efficiency factor YidD n=1 Tax=Ramlibacter sp. PS4R-6 TaxID=3133438 RepID=UPI0030AD44AA